MAHYFDEKPDIESKPGLVMARICGIDLQFVTDSDVFSKKYVDYGSRILLETTVADLRKDGVKAGNMLDIGCGYGPIGITMKRAFPAMDVTMVDVNERALALCKENATRNQCAFVHIFASDGTSAVDTEMDVVLTNPPIRAGKATVFSFYEGAYAHMKTGARLYVVIQKKQGAASSQKKLEELFGACEILAKEDGYWVIRAVK